jgi:hypothetical protein
MIISEAEARRWQARMCKTCGHLDVAHEYFLDRNKLELVQRCVEVSGLPPRERKCECKEYEEPHPSWRGVWKKFEEPGD